MDIWQSIGSVGLVGMVIWCSSVAHLAADDGEATVSIGAALLAGGAFVTFLLLWGLTPQ